MRFRRAMNADIHPRERGPGARRGLTDVAVGRAKVWIAAAAGGLILFSVPPSAAALLDRLQLNAIR